MKNEENFVENLVAPAPKLFDNEIVRRRNGPQRNWQRRKWRRRSCSAEKSWTRKFIRKFQLPRSDNCVITS